MTNNIMTDHDLIDQSDQKPEFNTITWRDTTHFDSEDDYRAQVVETPVTVNNSLIQDYVHTDNHCQPTYGMTPGFKSFPSKKFLQTVCFLHVLKMRSLKNSHIFRTVKDWIKLRHWMGPSDTKRNQYSKATDRGEKAHLFKYT